MRGEVGEEGELDVVVGCVVELWKLLVEFRGEEGPLPVPLGTLSRFAPAPATARCVLCELVLARGAELDAEARFTLLPPLLPLRAPNLASNVPTL